MSYKYLTCFTFMALMLMACTKENPLQKHPPEAVAQYIFKNSPFIGSNECVDVWSYPETANKTVLTWCDPTATKIANLLNSGGFGPNISSDNIQIPEIWLHIKKLYKQSEAESQERAKHIFDNVFKPKK